MASNGPGKISSRPPSASALRSVTRAPSVQQFSAAIASAASDRSAAKTSAPGSASARLAAMQPTTTALILGEAAAAGAHVEQGPCPAFVVYHPGDQLLGFGAGDQHPFAYGEAVPVEFRVPHHVLHGTAGGELCGHRFEPIGRHRCAGVGQQGR